MYCVGLGVIDYETVDLGGFPVESVCLNVEYEDVLGSPYQININISIQVMTLSGIPS